MDGVDLAITFLLDSDRNFDTSVGRNELTRK
ncbi:hypothetical protein CLFO_05950 [Clostridium formicaceticum]|uniref:Uncharacterized protein n=1 Tax=Clostridium formicaceticum TaxID=1497 RepID=A0AAC9RJK3_9CLOT|nr:hypothetical protein CLFO_05950 [Clostridium formicaceticum]